MKVSVDFEKETLTQLLKVVFFGSWVKNAMASDEDRDPSMDSFVQYVLGTIWNAGEKTRIVVGPEGQYDYAPEFIEVLLEQVDEYESEVFWDELVEQLAKRDYFQKNPSKIGKPLEGKAAEEADVGIEREKDKYDKEFEERGVERLRIVR